jgi:hypothetical protein
MGIILCQAADTQPLLHFQNVKSYPASSSLPTCWLMSQAESVNQAILLTSVQSDAIATGSTCVEMKEKIFKCKCAQKSCKNNPPRKASRGGFGHIER